MTLIITKLSENLIIDFKEADEIWIAVALIKKKGWKIIHSNLKPNCKQNFLIGLDLPTDPEVLIDLDKLQLTTDNINVRLYIDKNKTFHPKLYLIRKGNDYSGYIGSANCTDGGLNNNVELSTNITDKESCEKLIQWFNTCFNQGSVLRTKFIEKYEADFKERVEKRKQDDNIVDRIKQNLDDEFKVAISNEIEFIKVLKQYRSNQIKSGELDYNDVVKLRDRNVKELNEALDYPNFNNIDIDKYFRFEELGHLIPIPKPSIKEDIKEVKELLHWLTDESKDIAVRYEKAINGNLKIWGLNKAFVTKILIAHKPDLYFVKNKPSEQVLKKYGFKTQRGLNEGAKYKKTCEYLRDICKQTGIKDLAVLDYYLFIEGSKK